MIDVNPTRMDTVYTILEESVAIADSLELDSMNQAIYPNAQQIVWQNDSFKERFVFRVGDCITSMAHLDTIGNRFQ